MEKEFLKIIDAKFKTIGVAFGLDCVSLPSVGIFICVAVTKGMAMDVGVVGLGLGCAGLLAKVRSSVSKKPKGALKYKEQLPRKKRIG